MAGTKPLNPILLKRAKTLGRHTTYRWHCRVCNHSSMSGWGWDMAQESGLNHVRAYHPEVAVARRFLMSHTTPRG